MLNNALLLNTYILSIIMFFTQFPYFIPMLRENVLQVAGITISATYLKRFVIVQVQT